MPPLLMKQGRAGILTAPASGDPCGTAHLGPCVGVMAGLGNNRWWVAHIDCEAVVKRPSGACYDSVAQYAYETAIRLVGQQQLAGPVVFATTGGDHSTPAILAGLNAVFANAADTRWEGIVAVAGGTPERLRGGPENNEDGTDAFRVPSDVPGCPG